MFLRLVLTCGYHFAIIIFVFRAENTENFMAINTLQPKVECAGQDLTRRLHMPIKVDYAASRSKKVAVTVEPAEWQIYIAH